MLGDISGLERIYIVCGYTDMRKSIDVYGEDGLPAILLYGYTPTRSGNNAADFLDGFQGYLETDGYQGYNKVSGIKRCCCWAHIRRYFVDAIPKGKQLDYNQPAVQGVHYCDRLARLESSITSKCGADYEKRKQMRLEADDYIVKELGFQGAKRSYDQIIAVGETVTEEEIEALCDKMYQYALGQCRNKQEEASVKKISKKNLLSWGLLQMQDGKVVPTNGYMLLAQNDNLDAAIQCGVFKGTSRAVFLDRKEYDGPIYEQVDEAYQFVLRNIRMGAEFNGIQRRDVYELPVDSIRELIANAVVHRSYLEPAKVQVALYDDRLEITSPGMLIGGFSIEDLKSGCCQARNRGIVSAFTYMKIIEQWGSGIPRLLENCKSAGLREPELLEIGGSFRVNMFRNTELSLNNSGEVREKDGINETVCDKFVISSDIRDKFGESAANIAGLMCEKPESTLDEIAEVIGVTRRTVEKQVKKLKEAGIVVRVGSNKSGVWKVTESGK